MMKKFLLLIAVSAFLSACKEEVKTWKDSKIQVVELCNKRKAITARQDKAIDLFMRCTQSPKRVQTGTDDESDVISECRIVAGDVYGVLWEEEEFMRDTEAYIPDCLKME